MQLYVGTINNILHESAVQSGLVYQQRPVSRIGVHCGVKLEARRGSGGTDGSTMADQGRVHTCYI